MSFKKILLINISEGALDPEYWNKLKALAEKTVSLPKDSPQILEELKDTDCILSGFAIPITKEHIDAAPNLKYIGTLAVAYHKIDTDYAKQKGIPVTNIAGYCTDSVAEFILAAILNEIRHLDKGKLRIKNKNYQPDGMSASEIKGKTFAVFGAGSIGRRTAELAQGFGAQVKYWSRKRKSELDNKGITYQDKDLLLAEADFISLNFAHTPETEKFLNREALQKIKSGAVIVNTVPMETVDIDALVERLKMGDVTFILDHSDEMTAEDLEKVSPYKNCVIYPPIAFLSKEARLNKQNLFIGNLENFITGKPSNVVNS